MTPTEILNPYARQISRLTCLGPLPATIEGTRELRTALEKFTEPQAAEIITEIIQCGEFDGDKRRVMPADIVRVGSKMYPPNDKATVKRDCVDCGGSGWRYVHRAAGDGAERCGCGSVPALASPFESRDLGPKPVMTPEEQAEWDQICREFNAKLRQKHESDPVLRTPPPLPNPITAADVERAKEARLNERD